jgi:serine/threonine protein kinase
LFLWLGCDASGAQNSILLEPDVDSAPFEIVEIMSSGAYGTVAVARYLEEGGRIVAVKALRSDHLNRPKILARARDEARMLFRLRHPNIVRLEQLLDVGGRPVLLMEWVEGVSLRELLNHLECLPIAVALEIVRQIAQALDAAYGSLDDEGRALRIIHRDIKPANVLLSLSGEVKLVDFGVATGNFDDRETSTVSTIMGTQGYMAPERLDGVADSPAIDVYAMGVTLYELLTGRMPQLPSAPKNHAAHLARRLERIEDLPDTDSDLLATVAALVGRMCTYAYEERPSAADVHASLVQTDGHAWADLSAFADLHARPIYEARRPTEPVKQHREYQELAFLERPWTSTSLQPLGRSVPVTRVAQDSPADQKLRAFLIEPGWTNRRRELKWLLATNPDWSEAPFLEVLERYWAPWWKIWVRRPTAAEIQTVLDMLRYRRSPTVLDRVRGLRHSPNPDIAGAARILVDNP